MATKIKLTLQVATGITKSGIPNKTEFMNWIKAVFAAKEILKIAKSIPEAEFTIRLVGKIESAKLNAKYRAKPYPTNVLSFSYDLPKDLPLPLLGDLVICMPVVRTEAKQQNKTVCEHLALLTIHGILHILGFDHNNDRNAEKMEKIEKKILENLCYNY